MPIAMSKNIAACSTQHLAPAAEKAMPAANSLQRWFRMIFAILLEPGCVVPRAQRRPRRFLGRADGFHGRRGADLLEALSQIKTFAIV